MRSKSLLSIVALAIVCSVLVQTSGALSKKTNHNHLAHHESVSSESKQLLTTRSLGDEKSLSPRGVGHDLDAAAGHEKKYILVKKKPKHKKIKSEVYEPKMKYKKVVMKVPVKVMKKKKVKGYLVKKHYDHHDHY